MKIVKQRRKIEFPMLMSLLDMIKVDINIKTGTDSKIELETVDPVEFYDHLGNNIDTYG